MNMNVGDRGEGCALSGERCIEIAGVVVDLGESFVRIRQECGCEWSRNPEGDGPYTMQWACARHGG